jgi:DNA-binding protein H-NS
MTDQIGEGYFSNFTTFTIEIKSILLNLWIQEYKNNQEIMNQLISQPDQTIRDLNTIGEMLYNQNTSTSMNGNKLYYDSSRLGPKLKDKNIQPSKDSINKDTIYNRVNIIVEKLTDNTRRVLVDEYLHYQFGNVKEPSNILVNLEKIEDIMKIIKS